MGDRQAEKPGGAFRYHRLAVDLEIKIKKGVYKAGEKLPSIRKLQMQTGFSMTTAYRAFIELEKRGLVEARPKSGYFVRPASHCRLPGPACKQAPAVPHRVSVNALARSVVEAMGNSEILQLGGTLTAPELLPTRQLQRCLRTFSRDRVETMFTTYADPSGEPELRRQIAQRLLDFPKPVDSDDLVITSGCIEAISLCLQAVTEPGDTVVVESPTYPWFLQIIEDLNLFALEVTTDPVDGIDLPLLEKAVSENRVKVCLLVPNFQNPLGLEMSIANKRALVRMMSARDIPIIEDDIHGDLYFNDRRPLPLKAFDEKGLVLYCSSFSKTLAPGLRIGWTLPGRFREAVRRLKLNLTIASPVLNQHLIGAFLQTGAYERHLRRLRTALKNQASDMARAVARYFPEGTCVTSPQGGLTLWIDLNPHVDSLAIFNEARRHRIAILPGLICSTTSRYRNCIRLSYGFPFTGAVENGIRTLGGLIRREQAGAAEGAGPPPTQRLT